MTQYILGYEKGDLVRTLSPYMGETSDSPELAWGNAEMEGWDTYMGLTLYELVPVETRKAKGRE